MGICVFSLINKTWLGGVVGLQAALNAPEWIEEVVIMDLSLRLLHVKKQSSLQKVVVPAIQYILRETSAGSFFFKRVGKSTNLSSLDLERSSIV